VLSTCARVLCERLDKKKRVLKRMRHSLPKFFEWRHKMDTNRSKLKFELLCVRLEKMVILERERKRDLSLIV